jgi:GTPase Era involved in 16S rRNA processing
LKIYNTKINLKLLVKVKKNWRDNDNYLNDLGYKN